MNLRDYIKILRQRKILILTFSLIILSVYGFYIYRQPPEYLASSKIVLIPSTLTESLMREVAITPKPISVSTQLELIEGRPLAEKVMRIVQKKYNLKISLNEIRESVKAYQIEKTEVIQIDARCKDPDVARIIVNTYAEEAVEKNRELAQSELKNARSFLAQQITKQKNRLAQAEKAKDDFNRQYGVFDFSTEVNTALDRISDYQSQQEQITVQIQTERMLVNQIKSQLGSIEKFTETSTIVSNPAMQELKKQLLKLEIRLTELTNHYTPLHPKVTEVQNQINALKERMSTKVARFVQIPHRVSNPLYDYLREQLVTHQTNQVALQIKTKAIQTYINRERQKLSNLSAKQLEYLSLEQEVRTAEKVYSLLQQMYEQIRVSQAMKLGNAQIAELAKKEDVILLKKSTPESQILIILISIMIGIGMGVVAEILDDRVKTPSQAKKYLNLAVLGSIPFIKARKERIITEVGYKSSLSECYRKICFQLKIVSHDLNAKGILITSIQSQEGKSTILANLGITLAREGKKVLLIDADFRKPVQHKIMGISSLPGLSNILSGKLDAERSLENLEQSGELSSKDNMEDILKLVVRPTATENLFIITNGQSVAHPVELINVTEERMKALIEYTKKYFDYVFFDSSPLLAVVDASLIGQLVDGIVLVVDAKQTRCKEASRSKQMISSLKLKTLGVILNNVAEDEEDYYYYYYSRYDGKRVKRQAR